ncbi:hypothetical protein [Galactobacter caseinivorans]|uniref:Uncharacterized protein n=1 Tax=Galactobacter caseinivorans TaxID=2676123 RepID=A0A496PM53_9MICC|nr:hypothetical protein [Galactobacter caseinivorans]RKW71620.1 hypothetical protein DWQ67_01900 [Galactobacter caseinivorans]
MAFKADTAQKTGHVERVRALAPGARAILVCVMVILTPMGVLMAIGAMNGMGAGDVDPAMLACGLGIAAIGIFLGFVRRAGVEVGPEWVKVRNSFRARTVARADVQGVEADGTFSPVLHLRDKKLIVSVLDPNSGGLPAFQRYRDGVTMRLMELLNRYVPADPSTGLPARSVPFQRGGVPADFVFPAGFRDVRKDPQGQEQEHRDVLSRCTPGHALAGTDFQVIATDGREQIAVSHHRLMLLRWQGAPNDPHTLPWVLACESPQQLVDTLRHR